MFKNGRIYRSQKAVGQRYRISIPSMDEFAQISQIQDYTDNEWGSGSWIEQIETGITGLEKYIYWKPKALKGRSKAGLQARKKLRNESMRGIPYLTPIIQEFIEGLKK
jgi:hypothetical protein